MGWPFEWEREPRGKAGAFSATDRD